MAEVKNIKKAADRIRKAIKKREKIVLYGDADLDGISSVIVLKESVQNLGGRICEIYFPDREKEGYGITEKGLNFLQKYSPSLLIVLDCGIGNFLEAKLAKKMGFELIIIDHHEILDKLPEASIIVDPKQKGDKYPFKYFSTTGIVFKLSQHLLGGLMTESLRKNFLELVALATIADMMRRTDENAAMIEEGLNSLDSSWRPGIRALLQLDYLQKIDPSQRVFKLTSLLNFREEKEGVLPKPFYLLTTSSLEKAKEMAEILLKANLRRKEKIKDILEEIEGKISESSEQLIFEENSLWDLDLLGVAASLLVQRYKKPVFLCKKIGERIEMGARAPDNFNVVEAMKKCSKYLISYGGHPQAGGGRLAEQNLGKLRDCLQDYCLSLK